MIETKLTFPTPDGKTIYGVKNSQDECKKLIIIVHGLGGDIHRHLHFNAARFFPEHGYDVIRINLYDRAEDARKLHECSISTHAEDIDTVVDDIKDEYEKIFLIGHSLGGPSIILSKQNANAAVFWDPSIVLDPTQQLAWEEVEPGGDYYLKSATNTLVSKAIYDQWTETNLDMVKQMKLSTKIICAGDGPLVDRWNQAISNNPVPYEYCIIAGAGHGFDEWGTDEELYDETLAYLEKH